jgi:prolyl-tRNA editing enzyme YbaK/EbsC (Cys-tRNA(Pro) deacylase)
LAGQSQEHTDLATTRAALIVEYLDAEGVDHTLIEHDPTMSAAEEARATGAPAHKVAKTIVLADGGGYALAVVPGDERLDLHKLRELLGATKSLRLATEAEIADLFPSFDVGAVPPFGPMFPKVEVVDRRLLDEERVLCAAGDHRHSVVLRPSEIVRMTDAVTADVCED